MLKLPNIISLIRIVLIPIFISSLLYYRGTGNENFRWLAIIVFVLAVLSDALDGFVARLKNQRSALGAFLDPMADKLLMASAVIVLSVQIGPLARLPIWFPILVIGRDLVIVVGSLLIRMKVGKITPQSSVAGKFTTFFQMLTIVWILVNLPLIYLPIYTAAIFTFISGAEYIFLGIRQLQEATG